MGQVCAKHNEFYEKECRYCEPALGLNAVLPAKSLFGIDSCDLVHRRLGPGGGHCHICRYDILPVAPMPLPPFKKIVDLSMAEYLGAEKIGPQESKFWMDFISQEFCKAEEQDLSESTLDRHGGCE